MVVKPAPVIPYVIGSTLNKEIRWRAVDLTGWTRSAALFDLNGNAISGVTLTLALANQGTYPGHMFLRMIASHGIKLARGMYPIKMLLTDVADTSIDPGGTVYAAPPILLGATLIP